MEVKHSQSIPDAMTSAAVEALAARLDAADVLFRFHGREPGYTEYLATLDDGSSLTVQIGTGRSSKTRLGLSPKGVVTEVLDLGRIDDLVWVGLSGRPYHSGPPLRAEDVPGMTRFLDRAREACLAAGENSLVLASPSGAPAPR